MSLVGRPRRVVVAVLAAALALPLFVVALAGPQPAGAVATPVLRKFTPETITIRGENNPPAALDRIRATFVINHPVGVFVDGMRASQSRATHPGGWSPVAGNVRVIAGGSNYTVVEAAFDPGNDNWMGSSCGIGSGTRHRDLTARIDLRMSDGTVFNDNSWGFRALANGGCGGPEDPATLLDTYDSTLNAVVSPGGSIRTHYKCDDGDSSGDADSCDNVIISLRNAYTDQRVILECSTSSVPCENNRQFNADDNTERNGTVPVPGSLGRGRWLIEGDFCSESQRNAGLTTCIGGSSVTTNGRQPIGSFYYNPSGPTASLSSSLAGGGTLARPNTGAVVTHTVDVTSNDGQVAEWDTNNDGAIDEVAYGESGDQGAPTLSAAQRAYVLDTTTRPEGSSCAVRVRVRDNGGINGADPSSATTSLIPSSACTINRQPTGASQADVDVFKGTASTIPLANADGDGDPVQCAQVGTATNGTVSFAGCSASFTAAAGATGGASFQYRVLDDHNGVSPTYTISMDIVNRPPTAQPQTETVVVGGTTTITLGGADPDGDTTTCATTNPTGGSLSGGSSCTRTYTAPSTVGTYTFLYARSDGLGGDSSPATVTINVVSPDVTITKTHDGDFNAGEEGTYRLNVVNIGQAATVGTITVADTLPAGMTFARAEVGTSGFTCSATAGGTQVTCTRTTPLPPGQSALIELVVDVAEDADAVTNTATVSATPDQVPGNNSSSDLTLVNWRPSAAAVSVETAVDTPVAITLSGADPEGGALTYQVGTPSSGQITGTAPDLTFTPAPGSGADVTFTYTVTDPNGHVSHPATVTVTVVRPGAHGRVTADDGGAGIGGITVRLYQDGVGYTPFAATTDDQGFYDLGGTFTAGTYRVVFTDPLQEYVTEWWDDSLLRSASTPVVLDPAEETDLSAGLAAGAEIDVTVTNPGTFTVALYNQAPTGASAFRSTPAVAGSTSFRGLPAGTYYVSVTDPSGALVAKWSGNQTVRASAAGITVGTGEEAASSFTLPSPNTISGTVSDAVDGPLEGITVQAYEAATGAYVKAGRTDGFGEYAIRGVPVGSYKLIFRDATGAHPVMWFGGAEVIGSAPAVTVPPGGVVTADTTLPRTATLGGTVTGGPTGSTGLAGARVTLYRGTAAVRTVTADGNGAWTAAGLVAGDYTVLFNATGHRAEYNLDRPRRADADVIVLAPGATATADAQLTPS